MSSLEQICQGLCRADLSRTVLGSLDVSAAFLKGLSFQLLNEEATPGQVRRAGAAVERRGDVGGQILSQGLGPPEAPGGRLRLLQHALRYAGAED